MKSRILIALVLFSFNLMLFGQNEESSSNDTSDIDLPLFKYDFTHDTCEYVRVLTGSSIVFKENVTMHLKFDKVLTKAILIDVTKNITKETLINDDLYNFNNLDFNNDYEVWTLNSCE